MKDQDREQEWRQRFKQEADELLFDDLRWDNRMQEKVLQAASRERDGLARGGGARSRLGVRRKLWAYGSAAMAAVLLGIVFVSSPMLRGDTAPPTTLLEPGGARDTPRVETRALQTPEEAGKLFGDGFLTPDYAPGLAKLSGVFAHGIREGRAAKIVMNYMHGDIAYSVIEERGTDLRVYNGYKKVEIRGVQGYLKPGESDAELHWSADGVHYAVVGAISDPEAVQIAESMK